MSYTNRILKRVLAAIVALTLSGCRLTVMPIISISELQDAGRRTVTIAVSTDSPDCDVSFLNRIADIFVGFQTLSPAGCFVDNGQKRAYWNTTLPLLRKGDEGKIPYLSASIYYSKNSSVIATFNNDFYGKIKKYAQENHMELNDSVSVVFQFNNDTKKPVKIAVQGVYVNSEPVGNEISVYQVKPSGKIWIKLSNVGTNSLLLEGIEPVGVVPALQTEDVP